MSKKPILTKRPKTILALILVCLITIALTGCDSSNKMPAGGLDLTAKYASTTDGKYSVTVKDVYEKLRYNAVSYVEDSVYKILFKEEIDTVAADVVSSNQKSKYRERLEEIILKDIYGTSDEEEIAKLHDKEVKEITYVDKMFQKGYAIETTDFSNAEDRDLTSVYANYYLEVAKYVAAYNKLSEKFEDFSKDENDQIKFKEPTDDSYFTKEDVVTWYKNNYENTGDVKVLLVRFLSQKESEKILAKFGLKSTGGKWYQIKLDEEKPEKWDTKTSYDEYYKNYKLNLTGGESAIDDFGNGNATVLKVLAAIYNSVYGEYRQPLELDPTNTFAAFKESYTGKDHLLYYNYVKSILEKDHSAADDNDEYNDILSILDKYEEKNAETILLTKERLDKYSSSLTDYVYNTLKTEAAEEGKAFTQYNTVAKGIGNYYYLVYKVSQAEVKQEETEKLYEEVDDVITFKNKEFLNEILNEMFEEEINENFIHTVFHERIEDAKVKIFDSIIEAQLMYSSSSELAESYSKNKNKNNNNNIIAEVTYKGKTEKIYVKDAFEYLEPLYGTQIAQNLLFKQFIKNTEEYKALAADQKEYDRYVETVKSMLYYFANDYYSSSGFPASIGKYNFMMLYYGTANVDEVVKDFLMVSEITSSYLADFNKQFKNVDFYNKVWEYAKADYNNFYSLTVSGLTVYADLDEDGKADTDALSNEKIKNAANELLNKAYDIAINSNDDYETTLNNVISEFNDSSRIADSNPTTPEYTWAYYRSLGLHLELSSFGTITNSTKDADKNIQSRVFAISDKAVDKELGFISKYLDTENTTTEDDRVTRLLVTGGTNATSAKYEKNKNDEKDIYSSVNVIINGEQVKIDLTYEEDLFTEQQVKAYIAEYILLGDVYSLPSSTITALDEYVLPYITKYVGNASQMNIVGNELGSIKFDYNEALSENVFSAEFIAEYKDRENFLKEYIEILENTEDNYDVKFDAWWNEMYEGGNK